jgi:uncharacterized protein (TIGR03437 family)
MPPDFLPVRSEGSGSVRLCRYRREHRYPAPIVYTSAGAVSAIVPYELAGQSTANVSVSFGGSVSAQFTQPLAPTAPHFFTRSYPASR